MQGLMLKLLNVDSASERALRVVAYFDQLGRNRPDVESIVRATALIADCPAGLELADRGLIVRFSPEGTAPASAGVRSMHTAIACDSSEAGTVWLEREGQTRELDEFIVERFALAAGAMLDRQRPSFERDLAQGFSDPALVQLLLNDRTGEAERSRAARLIGLHPDQSIQLVALEPSAGVSIDSLPGRLRDHWQRSIYLAELSRHLVSLVIVTRKSVDWAGVMLDGRAASGPVVDLLDAPKSWAAAREGLRFAAAGVSWPPHIDSDDLGVVRLLGQLDPSLVRSHPDIARIEHLATEPSGTESILILDHFLHSDSVRAAARELNYHHSTLQTRVRRIGNSLGLDLTSAAGRERASLALLLWRVFK